MSKNLYIATTEARSGKSAVALGVMETLIRDRGHVGFFRPIVHTYAGKQDNDIQLLREHFHLDMTYQECYAYTSEEAQELLTSGKQGELLDGVLSRYKKLEERFDFVLCEGTDFGKGTSAFEFEINAEIASNLAAPVLLVNNAQNKTAKEVRSAIELAIESFEEMGCKVISTVVNRVDEEVCNTEELYSLLQENVDVGGHKTYFLPNEPSMVQPTLAEVQDWLEAEVLYGERNLYKLTSRFSVGAMHVENFLNRVQNESLVIIPGDRNDILLGCLLSLKSKNISNISGIVLTGGMKPQGVIKDMLDGMPDLPIAILSVAASTYDTALKMDKIHATISSYTPSKIVMALGLFDKYIDHNELKEKISLSRSTRTTPKMFEYGLLQRAKSNKQHIVLPEGEEERILRAAEILCKRDVVKLTLLGNPDRIAAKINSLGLDLPEIGIIEPTASPHFDDFVETYCELRKNKGATVDVVKDIMADVNTFGTMMIYKDLADGMVSGSIHTTAQTIRPAFQIIKTKPGASLVSSVLFMCLEDRVLVYGDCAINPNPDAQELAEIAIGSALTAQAFGIEPRVAMLSYSTGDSGSGTDVERVREATKIAQELRPDLLLEGPMQYDAAVEMSVAKTKMPGSAVAGRATVFVFPDLNTGNNTYKAVQRSAKAIAIGPVLQGLNKPVNDLSRGCLVADIVSTVAITAIQAQGEKAGA
ncbi:MAG: phosphate acetyltransferase [Spirochaetota bacterium]